MGDAGAATSRPAPNFHDLRLEPAAADVRLSEMLFRRPHRAPGAAKEYLRIRVKGRFDVVLRKRPEEDAAIYINEQDVLITSTRRKHRRTPESAESSGIGAA